MCLLLVSGVTGADEQPPLAPASDEAVADMEFLEYLGSWDATDDEWLLLATEENETHDEDHDVAVTKAHPKHEEDDDSED